MGVINKSELSGIKNEIKTGNLTEFSEVSGNLYEALVVMGKRANQISKGIKEELNAKLEEFSYHTDALEEIMENREQIEISRYYERMPHATLIAKNEYLNGKIYVRDRVEEEESN